MSTTMQNTIGDVYAVWIHSLKPTKQLAIVDKIFVRRCISVAGSFECDDILDTEAKASMP